MDDFRMEHPIDDDDEEDSRKPAARPTVDAGDAPTIAAAPPTSLRFSSSHELPFLVTHWLSGVAETVPSAARAPIQRAVGDLCAAFTALGAFGTTIQPSLQGMGEASTRHSTYMDLKRSWPSCSPDHLQRLLQSTHSLVSGVQDAAQRSLPENHVLASTEAWRRSRSAPPGAGRTLQDAIVLDSSNTTPPVESEDPQWAVSALHAPVQLATQRLVQSPPTNHGTMVHAPSPVMHLASQELLLASAAATSMRQYLETRSNYREQQMHLRSLQRSLQHQQNTLVQLGQDRTRLCGSDDATFMAQLDEIHAGEQNCERVLAQLQRQLPPLEAAAREQSRQLTETRWHSRDAHDQWRDHRRQFWDPLRSTQRPVWGNNRLLQNICHRPLGMDRWQGGERSVPRSMGRIRAGVALLEQQKGLLYRRISYAATINTHLSYPVYCLRFDRSGRYFVTGADDYLVKVFCLGGHVTVQRHGRIDPASYARGAVLVCTLKGHAGVINDIGVSSDNSFLATASEDGDCRVWGLRDGCPIAILRGHVGGANMVSWSTLTPFRLVTTGADGLARTWDIREACLKRYRKWIGMRAEYNQESNSVEAPTNQVVDTDTSPMEAIPIPPLPAALPLEQPIPLPPLPLPEVANNDLTVVGNENSDNIGHFVANDILDEGVKLLSKLQHGATLDERLGGPGTRARRSAVKVICVSRCPYGGHFATGSDDGICRVWLDEDDSVVERIDKMPADETSASRSSTRLPTDRLLLTLQGHLSPITDLHYSNKGDRLITASQKDGVVRIWTWDIDSDGVSLRQASNQDSRVRSTSHILLKLTNPTASPSTDCRRSGNGPRSRSNRSITTSISCDVAVWTHDDTKIITSQSELTKQNSNAIVVGSQYLFLWDSFSGHCLIGIPGAHTMACPVVLPHPSIASVFCSAGADGIVKLWDWESGKCIFSHENVVTFGPIEAHERGKNFGYLDGDFSPDGMSLALSDDGGRVTVLGPFAAQSSSWTCPEWMKEQYFSNDYYDLFYDSNGYCVERGSERPPHLAPRGARCSHSGAPFSVQVNDALKGLTGPLPLDENTARWARARIRSMALQRRHESVTIKGNIVRQFDATTSILIKNSAMLPLDAPSKRTDEAHSIESPENNRPRTGIATGSVRRLSSNYRWRDYSDLDIGEEEEHETDDEDFELNETTDVAGRVSGIVDSDSDDSMAVEDEVESVKSPRRSLRQGNDDGESSDEYVEYVSTNNVPSGLFIADYDLHFFRMMSRDEGNSVHRLWLRRNESSSSYGGRKTYTPQIGDSVVYIPRTHQNTLAAYPGVQSPPWQDWPDEALWPVVRCCIRHIRFRFPYKAYQKEIGSVVAKLTLEITGIPEHSSERIFGWPTPSFTTPARAHIFELALFENNEDNYLIPFGLYVSRLRRLENVLNDQDREARVEAFFGDSNERNLLEDPAYVSYNGTIIRYSDNFDSDVNSPIIYGSGFNCLAVLWENDTNEEPDQVSPWDVSVQSLNRTTEEPERPNLTEEEKKRVRDAFNVVIRLPGVDEFFLLPVDITKYSDYATRIEVPMDLSFIRDRLEADYYASRYSVVADVMLIHTNCQKYNGDTDELSEVAGSMMKTFEELVLDEEERIFFHKHDAPVVESSNHGSSVIPTANVESPKSAVQRRSQRIVPTRSLLEAVQGSVPKVKGNRQKARSSSTRQRSARRARNHPPVERSVLEAIQPQAVQTLEQLSSGRGQRVRGRVTRASTVLAPPSAPSVQSNSRPQETFHRALRSRQTLASHVYTENDRSDIDEFEQADHRHTRETRRGRNVSSRSFNPPRSHPMEDRARVANRSQGRSTRSTLEDTTENSTHLPRRGLRSRSTLANDIYNESDRSDVDDVESLDPEQTHERRRGRANALNRSQTNLAQNEMDESTANMSQPVLTSRNTRRTAYAFNAQAIVPSPGYSEPEASLPSGRQRASRVSSATAAESKSRTTGRSSRHTQSMLSTNTTADSEEDDSTLPSWKSPQKRRKASEESDFEDDNEAGDTSDSEMVQSSDSSKPVTKHRRASRSKASETAKTRNGKVAKSSRSVAETHRTSPARNSKAPSTYHVPSSSDFDSDDYSSHAPQKKRPISNGKKRKGTASPISKPKKKTKPVVDLFEILQVQRWPEIPIKRISDVTKTMLEDLRVLDEAEAFLLPVLENYPELKNVYSERISQPMDYRTIEEERLWYYQSITELQADLLLVFYNCMEFNEPDSPFYHTASCMVGLLEDKFHEVCDRLGVRLRHH